MERKFETFDEFHHECEIENIDCVTGKVVVGIQEEGGIRDHKCWQTSVPEKRHGRSNAFPAKFAH